MVTSQGWGGVGFGTWRCWDGSDVAQLSCWGWEESGMSEGRAGLCRGGWREAAGHAWCW